MSDASEIAAQLALACAQAGEAFAPVAEATDGYRAAREAEGYSSGLARRMAADYHAALLRLIIP